MPRSKKPYKSFQATTATVVPIGKEQSFDYFFRQYFAAVCFFAQSIIHNEEEAKDIVQDCFIKLWDAATPIEEKQDSVRSFLYTMVRNRCIDYVRKQQVIHKANSYLQLHQDDDAYFDELAFAELMRQVIEHIEALPAAMRNVLSKYYLEGKRHKAIAAETGSTENAVRMHKKRAVKLLREKLLLLISVLESVK